MKKAKILASIETTTALLEKAVSESVIFACLIRDRFSEQQAKVMLLWAKKKVSRVQKAIPQRTTGSALESRADEEADRRREDY
jgi:hypothetical protein